MPDEATAAALERAHARAVAWLGSLPDRRIPPRLQVADLVARLGPDLPEGPTDPAEVIELLAEAS